MPDDQPDVGPAAEHAYGLLAPLAKEDPGDDWILLRTIAGLTAGEETAWSLVEFPGASEALDPTTVDPVWLPLLAQVVGGRLVGGMTVEQQRAEVVTPAGRTRGLPEHLLSTAASHLQPPGRVQVRQRYDPASNDDAPGHITVRVRASDVRPGHTAALQRDLEDAIPAWLVGHVLLTNDRDWDDVAATYATWDDVHASNANWDDLLSS